MPNFTPKYLVIFILWPIMCVNLTYLESHSSFDNFHQNGKIENLLHIYTQYFAGKLCYVSQMCMANFS